MGPLTGGGCALGGSIGNAHEFDNANYIILCWTIIQVYTDLPVYPVNNTT